MARRPAPGKEMQDEEFLTEKEAAAVIGTSGSWLRRTSCPRVRCGAKLVRYPRAALVSWFLSHMTVTAMASGTSSKAGVRPLVRRPVTSGDPK